MLNPYVQIKTRASDPITVAGNKIVLVSRALVIQLPGLHGGLVWNLPVAAGVTTSDGQERILPVRDITRLVQLGIVAIGLVAGSLILMAYRRKPEG